MSASSVESTLHRVSRYTDWFGRPHLDAEGARAIIAEAVKEGLEPEELRFIASVLERADPARTPYLDSQIVLEGDAYAVLDDFVDDSRQALRS